MNDPIELVIFSYLPIFDFFNALVSADKGYIPLNLSDNIISDIVEPNIPDTIANIKQKSLHGRYFKELEQPEINIQASHA
jgi:hypothetical protein